MFTSQNQRHIVLVLSAIMFQAILSTRYHVPLLFCPLAIMSSSHHVRRAAILSVAIVVPAILFGHPTPLHK